MRQCSFILTCARLPLALLLGIVWALAPIGHSFFHITDLKHAHPDGSRFAHGHSDALLAASNYSKAEVLKRFKSFRESLAHTARGHESGDLHKHEDRRDFRHDFRHGHTPATSSDGVNERHDELSSNRIKQAEAEDATCPTGNSESDREDRSNEGLTLLLLEIAALTWLSPWPALIDGPLLSTHQQEMAGTAHRYRLQAIWVRGPPAQLLNA